MTSNQKLYIKNDDTSSERMSITSKIDKVNIHFDFAYAFTTSLFVFKSILSQRDAALLEKRQWKFKKIIDKKHTEQEWKYKIVWADSWVHKNELENAQRLSQQFEKKTLHRKCSILTDQLDRTKIVTEITLIRIFLIKSCQHHNISILWSINQSRWSLSFNFRNLCIFISFIVFKFALQKYLSS